MGQKQARAQTGPAELDGTGLTTNVFLLTTLWGPAGHDGDSLMGYFRRVAPIGSSSWPYTKGRWTAFGNIGGLKLMIESAAELVENDPMSRIPRSRGTRSILAQVEPRRMVT